MAEDEFWNLIEVMGGTCDEDAVARLTTALEARGGKAAMAFQERLARLLYELDRESLAGQPVRFGDDPPGSEPLPLSDDGFLYLRAGIVTRGRETYEAVLADPTLLAVGEWEECEELLYVAEEVAGDDIETKVSYETGSNHRHWAPQPEQTGEPWDQGLRPVYVVCRDLSKGLDVARVFADGHTEPSVLYPYPRYVSDALAGELVMTFSRAVALNGGLPPEVDAQQVQVLIDFGDAWQTQPEVGEPAEDPDLGIGRVRPVRIGVLDDEVRRWSPATRREALLALTASCLLAVLPGDHAARPEIETIRDLGAGHLPG